MVEKKRISILNLIISIAISVLLCLGIYFLSTNYIHDTMILIFTAMIAVYPGAAIHGKDVKQIIVEAIFFIFMFIVALAGLYISVLVAGGGFVLLGIWSLLHYLFRIGVNCGRPFALGFFTVNMIMALFIILFLA